MSVEFGSSAPKFVERHDCTTSREGIVTSVIPERLPPNALKADPGSAPMVTGAPVISACFTGSR